ncbi:MAG: 5'/3'-nucleotidase SurE [Anaerolineae bacterium]|nr:5'/3'-nucleotidase SurE [Anaerolineae bacterium]
MKTKAQILLTNDDGIESPGLWAAARALSAVGYVTVAAPREQTSASGRSLPLSSDGKIEIRKLQIGNQEWDTFAIGGTPAQAVLHAVLEIMPQRPDLVVSGINYGENIGTAITLSGTVGAALEAAALNIPAIAVSLQVKEEAWLSYSTDFNFSTAAHFTALFARMVLAHPLPPDVDLLKIDVPDNATPQTPWHITRLARHRYWIPTAERKGGWQDPGRISGYMNIKPEEVGEDTDAYALAFSKIVSVTPLSLDQTSRVDLADLERQFRKLLDSGSQSQQSAMPSAH